jgi:glycosyltransferase involved in cell wall biosynthesis
MISTTTNASLIPHTNETGIGNVEVAQFGRELPDRVAVSVVVATYNRPDGLSGLLRDLSGQDLGDANFEVVVVDDGGTENVIPLLGSTEYAFPLTVVRQGNGGPGQARHRGISHSHGEVVVIVDDDMHVGPRFLAEHLACHAGGADVVLGHIVSPNVPTLPLFERFHMEVLERSATEFESGQSRPEGIRLCTGNVSFRRSAYDAVGGFDLSLVRCEDRDLGLRFEVAGYVFAFSTDARSEHQSDHEDVGVWQKRSRLFGELDTKISRKHPTHRTASPWSFFPKLPMFLRPLLLVAACFPKAGATAGARSYRLGLRIEKTGRTKIAMSLASLCYALEYFSGVGTAFGRPRLIQVLRSWRGFSKVRADASES